MGKASSAKQDATRRDKIAAMQASARRAEMRNRLLIAGGAVIAVIAVVVALIVIKTNTKPSVQQKPTASTPTGASLSMLVKEATTVPASALNAVGAGGSQVASLPASVKGSSTTLTVNGKPEMLYMGAEFCPYCAAERWAMVVALSRFGTFSGLHTTHSAIVDGGGNQEPYPDTSTWSFYKSTFTSPYLAFTPVEMNTNVPDTSTGGYTTLQTPTGAQQSLLAKYDAPPYVSGDDKGSIPFVDFGNKYLIIGASYNPGVLSGLTWSQIAADLSKPSSPVAQSILGTANYMTAAICKTTGNQPASACTPVVKSLEGKI